MICHIIEVNTLRPRQNGRHFPDDIFKYIFLNRNVWISINISLKFVPSGLINVIPALVQIMALRRPDASDKPFSEPMLVSLLTHICVTRPKWVKYSSSIAECSEWFEMHIYLVSSLVVIVEFHHTTVRFNVVFNKYSTKRVFISDSHNFQYLALAGDLWGIYLNTFDFRHNIAIYNRLL